MSDEEQHDEAPRRRLRIDLGELEAAMGTSTEEAHWYLNTETGELVFVTDETRQQLERIYEKAMPTGTEQVDLNELLQASDLHDWEKELIVEADAVGEGYGKRFISVPSTDTWKAYGDMEAFIATVGDARLRARLERAIQGRGAFGRFRDELLEVPKVRERWFAFKTDQVRARAVEWLEEGIEAVFGGDPLPG